MHILQGAGARQQVEALEDEADLLVPQHGPLVGGQARNLLPVKPVLGRRWAVEAPQDIHQRAFARAGCAHQRDQLALLEDSDMPLSTGTSSSPR